MWKIVEKNKDLEGGGGIMQQYRASVVLTFIQQICEKNWLHLACGHETVFEVTCLPVISVCFGE